MPDAYLLIGSAGAPQGGDAQIKTWLENLGFTVTYRTSTDSAPAGENLIVIAGSAAGSSTVNLTTYTGPILSLEWSNLDEMNMASGQSVGSGTSVYLVNAGHDLQAGFSNGTLTVCGSSMTIVECSTVGSGAIVIGQKGSSDTDKIFFAYEEGATLIGGGSAASRRGAMLVYWDAGAGDLNANYVSIFNAFVNWLANTTIPVQPNDLAVDIAIEEPSFTQWHQVYPDDLQVDIEFTKPAATFSVDVFPNDLSVTVDMLKPFVGSEYSIVTPQYLYVDPTISQPSLFQLHNVQPNDLSVAIDISRPGVFSIGTVFGSIIEVAEEPRYLSVDVERRYLFVDEEVERNIVLDL